MDKKNEWTFSCDMSDSVMLREHEMPRLRLQYLYSPLDGDVTIRNYRSHPTAGPQTVVSISANLLEFL